VSKNVENLKILVLENIDITGELIESALTSTDTNEVFIARNSNHALISYQVNQHDLLIVDLDVLPDGGLDFIGKVRAIQEDGVNPNVPIILTASYASDETVEEAKTIGTNDLLIKPFSFYELIKHITFVMHTED
jgi:DNA-binding response OmpR family regulator